MFSAMVVGGLLASVGWTLVMMHTSKVIIIFQQVRKEKDQ